LNEQVELYIKSNPNYAKKTKPAVSDEELQDRIFGSFKLIEQIRIIHSLLKYDDDFVEIT
jgi:hypothetical protein